MAKKDSWKFRSLDWIHRIRQEHYRETKASRLEAWLKPVDLEKAAEACRQMGFRVRAAKLKRRKTG